VVWISPSEEKETPAILVQPTISTSQNNLDSTTVNGTSEQLQAVSQSVWQQSQFSYKQLVSPSTSTNKNILSIDKGKLYIQTIEGEIVVEGTHIRFGFSPPEGQNIIPQPIEVK
jgi:redox-sensitive bicupin YhaK (pirin superfamily)